MDRLSKALFALIVVSPLLLFSPAWCDNIVPLSSIFTFQDFGADTRVLAIYDSSLFPAIIGIDVQDISFYSQGAPSPVAGETPIDLYLGTTSIPSANLSATYSDNISDGETLVYAGTVLPPDGEVSGFSMTLSLSSPFLYQPADGNLLLDIQNTGGEFMFPYGTAGAFPPHGVDGVSPVGSANGLAPLIELTGPLVSTPEPTSLAVIIIITVLSVVIALIRKRALKR